MPRKTNPIPTTKPAKRMRNKAVSVIKISPAKPLGKLPDKPSSNLPSKAGPKSPGKSARPLAKVARRGIAEPVTSAEASAKPWTTADTEEAFRRFREANPHPRGELEHVDPFTLLVAVVLSAQATDAGVNKATRALFAVADTPHKMVALGEEKLRDYIRTIGLFRTKAKNVIALSQQLIAEHGGVVPPSREALETLPGVGRKTASVVLNVAFGAETIAVDTHIFRVGNRTGLAPGANPLEVEMSLEDRVPPAYRRHAHHWLILHGRYTARLSARYVGRV